MTSPNYKLVKKGWREALKSIIIKFIKYAYSSLKWIFRYSGLEFIYRKFNPPKNSENSPTGFIWLVSIYVALFGIAFQRYEIRTFKIDNLVNSITAQLATERRSYALPRIPKIQWQPCPLEPKIFTPKSVFVSLFGDYRQYEEQVDYLKDILVDHRDLLRSTNLEYCDLRGTHFRGGNFEESSLMYAKLDQAYFFGVNFKNTDFFNAKFNNTHFNKCNFSGANLLSVDFEGTVFQNCNFRTPDLGQITY